MSITGPSWKSHKGGSHLKRLNYFSTEQRWVAWEKFRRQAHLVSDVPPDWLASSFSIPKLRVFHRSSRDSIPEGEGLGYDVRNMGNFNFSSTHVLTFFHHVEQCCYPSFLNHPHIPAMTSHVAYVIHAIITLITTQGLCNITLFPYVFLSLCIWDRTFLMFLTFFLSISYPCRLTHSV